MTRIHNNQVESRKIQPRPEQLALMKRFTFRRKSTEIRLCTNRSPPPTDTEFTTLMEKEILHSAPVFWVTFRTECSFEDVECHQSSSIENGVESVTHVDSFVLLCLKNVTGQAARMRRLVRLRIVTWLISV